MSVLFITGHPVYLRLNLGANIYFCKVAPPPSNVKVGTFSERGDLSAHIDLFLRSL